MPDGPAREDLAAERVAGEFYLERLPQRVRLRRHILGKPTLRSLRPRGRSATARSAGDSKESAERSVLAVASTIAAMRARLCRCPSPLYPHQRRPREQPYANSTPGSPAATGGVVTRSRTKASGLTTTSGGGVPRPCVATAMLTGTSSAESHTYTVMCHGLMPSRSELRTSSRRARNASTPAR